MFKFTVIDNKGSQWGGFQNASMARIMKDGLEKAYGPDRGFSVKPI
jgi:hypothetical protein